MRRQRRKKRVTALGRGRMRSSVSWGVGGGVESKWGVEAIKLKMKADPNWEGLGMLGDAIEPWSHRQ